METNSAAVLPVRETFFPPGLSGPPPAPEPDAGRTLIDALLSKQHLLTPVARFAREHEAVSGLAGSYSELIPLEKPGTGQQYAFGVNLDLCTACKACVSACHSMNGLDEEELWRSAGLIHGGAEDPAYQQTVTTACHHCADPACLSGCPVKAYEKDASTGIVRHLDDQCIGCQYCVLKCPYDVPKYSKKRGIVRKCDMCYHRLAANEAPACVQACPNGAITIRIVEKPTAAASGSLVPGAFASEYTLPATVYSTRKPIPANARPADADTLRLEHSHLPLVFMLVLTQLAAGLFAALPVLATLVPRAPVLPWALGGFVCLNLGLALSVLHLGRPLGAWRAFLGLATSWMSREIVAFGGFAAAAGGTCLVAAWPRIAAIVPALAFPAASFLPAVSSLTALLGLGSVFCSAMIYIDTRRPAWAARFTFQWFFGSVLVLGLTGSALLWSFTSGELPAGPALLLTGVLTAVCLEESFTRRQALGSADHPLHRMEWTVERLLTPWMQARSALSTAAAILSVLVYPLPVVGQMICLTLVFLMSLGAHLLERTFFFAACPAPRMPGTFHP